MTFPKDPQSLAFDARLSLQQVLLPTQESFTLHRMLSQDLEQENFGITAQGGTKGGDVRREIWAANDFADSPNWSFQHCFRGFERATLSSLRDLTDHEFDQEDVTLPSNLQSLTFGVSTAALIKFRCQAVCEC